MCVCVVVDMIYIRSLPPPPKTHFPFIPRGPGFCCLLPACRLLRNVSRRPQLEDPGGQEKGGGAHPEISILSFFSSLGFSFVRFDLVFSPLPSYCVALVPRNTPLCWGRRERETKENRDECATLEKKSTDLNPTRLDPTRPVP